MEIHVEKVLFYKIFISYNDKKEKSIFDVAADTVLLFFLIKKSISSDIFSVCVQSL